MFVFIQNPFDRYNLALAERNRLNYPIGRKQIYHVYFVIFSTSTIVIPHKFLWNFACHGVPKEVCSKSDYFKDPKNDNTFLPRISFPPCTMEQLVAKTVTQPDQFIPTIDLLNNII